MEGLLVILIFAILLFFNVPIAISLGVSSILYCVFFSSIPASMVIQTFVTSLDSFTLLGVPFFILAGDIMMQGGISKRLIKFSTALLGSLIGSMGIITVFGSMIFAAISGSGPATVACIGGVTIPAMIKEKYDRGFACALCATAGALGPLIPPSICLIMYGIIAQKSITTLFLAGVLPGLLTALALMLLVYSMAKRHKFGLKMNPELMEHVPGEKLTLWRSFWEAIWSLLVPVIILGGIYSGIFTPTEAAIIACVYALIIGMFVYKEIRLRDIPSIFRNTVNTNGTILILVACATAFGRVLAMEQVPTTIASMITGISTNKYLILLLINILLLVVGCFMETLSALIILTPILLPAVTALGVDPIHFALIIVMNLVIGQSTPPVGVNLFVAARIGNSSIEEMFKWLIPSLLTLIAVQQLITYIPGISLLLPKLFGMI